MNLGKYLQMPPPKAFQSSIKFPGPVASWLAMPLSCEGRVWTYMHCCWFITYPVVDCCSIWLGQCGFIFQKIYFVCVLLFFSFIVAGDLCFLHDLSELLKIYLSVCRSKKKARQQRMRKILTASYHTDISYLLPSVSTSATTASSSCFVNFCPNFFITDLNSVLVVVPSPSTSKNANAVFLYQKRTEGLISWWPGQ